jgi:hypothetical protein
VAGGALPRLTLCLVSVWRWRCASAPPSQANTPTFWNLPLQIRPSANTPALIRRSRDLFQPFVHWVISEAPSRLRKSDQDEDMGEPGTKGLTPSAASGTSDSNPQMWMDLSSEQDANIAGSAGFHVTALTGPACPARRKRMSPLSRCHMYTCEVLSPHQQPYLARVLTLCFGY